MDLHAEWLETDGLGGFASGTISGVRTRRYHALLLTARRPPTDRMVLVNGFDAWIDTPAGTTALSSQAYARDVVHPDGATRVAAFAREPWPQWTFAASRRRERRAGDLRPARRVGRRDRVATRRGDAAGDAARAPVLLRTRLPCAPARERSLRIHTRVARRATRVARLRRCARRDRAQQRRLRRTRRSGTATSATTKSSRAASTAARISPRPASSASTSARAKPCCSSPPRDTPRRSDRAKNPCSRASRVCAGANANGARRSRHRSSAPPTPMSCAAARARPSSPAIPGSPIGVATR